MLLAVDARFSPPPLLGRTRVLSCVFKTKGARSRERGAFIPEFLKNSLSFLPKLAAAESEVSPVSYLIMGFYTVC